MIKGRVHSIQSLGTLDGPGVRFVVFMQGCNLRCRCCHNPDTWSHSGGEEYTTDELLEKALNFRVYFGKKGGITLSGGEPLLQAEFADELFEKCHKEGINTCLDTAGVTLCDSVKNVLSKTDRVLLDVKHTDEQEYKLNTGASLEETLKFLDYLNQKNIPTTLRQVIIPTVTDTEENVLRLKAIADAHPCVDKIELLPFRKICQIKYDNMGIEFPFGKIPEPTKQKMSELEALIGDLK